MYICILHIIIYQGLVQVLPGLRYAIVRGEVIYIDNGELSRTLHFQCIESEQAQPELAPQLRSTLVQEVQVFATDHRILLGRAPILGPEAIKSIHGAMFVSSGLRGKRSLGYVHRSANAIHFCFVTFVVHQILHDEIPVIPVAFLQGSVQGDLVYAPDNDLRKGSEIET